MSTLIDSTYGKTKVKFLKVRKDKSDPKVQDILEALVEVLLRGSFDESYTKADNSLIIPTDTVKNTILVEAKNTDVWPIERFAAHLAQHFIGKYNWVSGLEVSIIQQLWTKIPVNGKPHAHSFTHDGPETRRCHLDYTRASDRLFLSASIKDLTVLKLTGSMFYGYNECDYTILKPTTDRILSTDVDSTWVYDSAKIGGLKGVAAAADRGVFDNTYNAARTITLETFALENSPSVQATMYNMAGDILKVAPEVATVSYALPNKHYILFNLEWKGIKDNKDLFYPSPDPSGYIKCTVGRKASAKL